MSVPIEIDGRAVDAEAGTTRDPVDTPVEIGERRYVLIDVRTEAEFAARPTGARLVPMTDLLAAPDLLPAGEDYLLICASGQRSLAAARELRRRGLRAHSLAGGLRALGS